MPEPPAVNEESFTADTQQPGRPPFDPARDWPQFVDHLMQDRPHLGSFLSFAYIVASTPDSLDLRFPGNLRFQFSQVTKKENRDEILRHLVDYAGKPVDLHMTIETGVQEEKQALQARPVTGSLDDDIKREPVIEQVLEIFDG
jgi:hypothetical protein